MVDMPSFQLAHDFKNISLTSYRHFCDVPAYWYFVQINTTILTVWSSFEIVLGYISICVIIGGIIIKYSETN